MTPEASWRDVGRALLGSWPDRVAAWGEEAIAAYVEELQARGLTPETALAAIRSCPAEQRFPPSAAELLGLARHDPSKPTFVEAYRLIYGVGGILRARPFLTSSWDDDGDRRRAYDQAAREHAATMHPLVASFVDRYGIDRLRLLEVDHPDYGDIKRRDLEAAWDAHVEAMDGRDLAAIAAPRRGEGLRKVDYDPLSALGARRPELPEPPKEGARP
jgi:hypothetical protein